MNTSPDLDALVAERARLKADADDATTRIKEIDNVLREQLTYGKHPHAGVTVSIEHNRRINEGRFRDAYPVDRHPDLWKVTVAPDLTKIRDVIAPADLDSFYDEGQPKVVVR